MIVNNMGQTPLGSDEHLFCCQNGALSWFEMLKGATTGFYVYLLLPGSLVWCCMLLLLWRGKSCHVSWNVDRERGHPFVLTCYQYDIDFSFVRFTCPPIDKAQGSFFLLHRFSSSVGRSATGRYYPFHPSVSICPLPLQRRSRRWHPIRWLPAFWGQAKPPLSITFSKSKENGRFAF